MTMKNTKTHLFSTVPLVILSIGWWCWSRVWSVNSSVEGMRQSLLLVHRRCPWGGSLCGSFQWEEEEEEGEGQEEARREVWERHSRSRRCLPSKTPMTRAVHWPETGALQTGMGELWLSGKISVMVMMKKVKDGDDGHDYQWNNDQESEAEIWRSSRLQPPSDLLQCWDWSWRGLFLQ